MRIGCLGVGRIGRSHASVVRHHPDVTGVVLADADAARAKDAAERLGCEWAETAGEVLAGADAVMITSPTSTHAELLSASIDHGVPVFCEKPVAPDVAGTRRVLQHVTRSGVQVQVGLQRRFDDGYRTAKQAVAEGRLGQLHRVHLVTGDQAPPPADYVPSSGGIFRDCHIHDFDVLRWVTGREVVEVLATGANRGADVFRDSGDVDNSAAVLRLTDDTLVTMQGSRYNGGGYDVRMELAGTHATYAVGLDQRVPLTSAEPDVAFPTEQPWPTFWERFQLAYAAEINAFVEMVRSGTKSPCPVEAALEALYVAEAAELSRAEGRRVAIEEVRA